MTKFTELRDRYKANKNATATHWKTIFSHAVDLANAFSAYLELPQDAKVTIDGAECPLLVLGIEKDGAFTLPPSRKEYEQHGSTIFVDMMLVLEVSSGGIPEKSIVFNLAVEDFKGVYSITDRLTQRSFDIQNNDYSEVIQYLYEIAESSV